MKQEIYLNHPTFGLLYRLCIIDQNQELFTTLYAQRLFFKVITKQQETLFEPLSRSESRLFVESRLRQLRRLGEWNAYKKLNQVYQSIFQ
jgi:PII interaction protein X